MEGRNTIGQPNLPAHNRVEAILQMGMPQTAKVEGWGRGGEGERGEHIVYQPNKHHLIFTPRISAYRRVQASCRHVDGPIRACTRGKDQVETTIRADLTLNSYENRTFWAWNSGFFTGFFTREKGTFFDPGPCLVVKIIFFFAHMIRFEHTYR